MIDFVHLHRLIPNYKTFLVREDIKFVEGKPYHSDKPIKYFWNNDLKSGCKIKVGYNNWIDFTGSITKYWYEENYTNLPYSDLACVIHSLADSLYSRPNELNLKSFEFGLNIPLEKPLNALETTDLALNYKNKFFQDMDGDNKLSIGKRCVLQEYQLKLYSKSMQYPKEVPLEMLRYEVKVHKKRFLRPVYFDTFEDLIDKDKLIYLKQMLIETFENIILYDNSIPIEELRTFDRNLCVKWQSPAYRKSLQKTSPRTFSNQKQRLTEIIEEYGELQLKSKLIQQFSDTWDNLMES